MEMLTNNRRKGNLGDLANFVLQGRLATIAHVHGEKYELPVAIRMVGEELASADHNESSPEFGVIVEGTPRNLQPFLRDEVYRFAAEALRNAFRHAAAKNVEVEIRYDKKYFRVRVRDDGQGIDPENLRGDGREGHYGLHGMRERAKVVDGKLTIWTGQDIGTEVELIIPAPRAKSTRRFWYFGSPVTDRGGAQKRGGGGWRPEGGGNT